MAQLSHAAHWCGGHIDLMQIHNLAAWPAHLPMLQDARTGADRPHRSHHHHYSSAAFGELAELMATCRIDTIQVPATRPGTAPSARSCRWPRPWPGRLAHAPARRGQLVRRPPSPDQLAPLCPFGVSTWAQALIKWGPERPAPARLPGRHHPSRPTRRERRHRVTAMVRAARAGLRAEPVHSDSPQVAHIRSLATFSRRPSGDPGWTISHHHHFVRCRRPPTGLPAIKCSASMVWRRSCTVLGRHTERPPGVGTSAAFNTAQISRNFAPVARSCTTRSRISSGQHRGRPGRLCDVLGSVVISIATRIGGPDH